MLPPVLFAAWVLSGCATYNRQSLPPEQARQVEQEFARRKPAPSPALAAQILALDPERVTDQQVREVLAQCPAPRIVNIHGGIFPVHKRMISFSEFLVGMGYPRNCITNPGDGTYTFSCYESSDKVAGMIAWYYEKEGLRPILVGHSQGGFQTIKVLRKFAGLDTDELQVWNPLTWESEGRTEITDPLTGQPRSVVGLRLGFATALCSGGLARVLPNQWAVDPHLRSVPDSVEEFTGFYKHLDLLGGDYLGFGSANNYEPDGQAVVVRTVRLPTTYHHGWIPDTKHLLESHQIKDWINNYRPKGTPTDAPEPDVEFDANSKNILWAAEVWYSIKKQWVRELQRYIHAQRSLAKS